MTKDPRSIFPDLPDGGFRTVWRGYDKLQVVRHIRQLETTIDHLKQRVAARLDGGEKEEFLNALARARAPREPDPPEYANLGARIDRLLRIAEEQASEIVSRAEAGATEILDSARREAGPGHDQ